MIPLCDVQQQYLSLKTELDGAILDAVSRGRYILGPNVQAFEREFADYCGANHAVGVGNGTDALHLALRALGIGPGDEVITTPFTFIATAEAISLVGAKPVFVDIDPLTFNMDPAGMESAITERTRAILPVHLYGQPCDMDRIMDLARRHGLLVVEDCAQAVGATYKGRRVGTIGDIGCFSFFPSKNLGTMGDGGMVVTNNAQCFEQVEMLRRHGGRVKYHHEVVGVNSRLDEIHAAILRVKLKYLDTWNDLRRGHAYRYNRLLSGMTTIQRPSERMPDSGRDIPLDSSSVDAEFMLSVYHQYTIQTPHRDQLVQHLQQSDIGCHVYYPVPLHQQQAYADLNLGPGSFPHAERAAKRCMSLPMYPELQPEQQSVVVQSVAQGLAAQQPIDSAA